MTARRYFIAFAALVATVVLGAFTTAAPASAQGWHRHHQRHPGYYFSYGAPRHCWTEMRAVRVQTRHGWRWRERPVRFCR